MKSEVSSLSAVNVFCTYNRQLQLYGFKFWGLKFFFILLSNFHTFWGIVVFTDGSGVLFFHFYRVKTILQSVNGPTHLFWLFENVASMKLIHRNFISCFLEVSSYYLSKLKPNIPDYLFILLWDKIVTLPEGKCLS